MVWALGIRAKFRALCQEAKPFASLLVVKVRAISSHVHLWSSIAGQLVSIPRKRREQEAHAVCKQREAACSYLSSRFQCSVLFYILGFIQSAVAALTSVRGRESTFTGSLSSPGSRENANHRVRKPFSMLRLSIRRLVSKASVRSIWMNG